MLNPLKPTGQVIGINNPALILSFAQVLHQLGTPKAITLHGREKLDEAGLGDKTDLAILSNGQIHLLELDPQELGLNPAAITTLIGGDVQENAHILKAVLQGKGSEAQQNVVALNAALAMFFGELIPSDGDFVNTFSQAVILAQDVIKSGEAWNKLEKLAQFLA